MGQFLKSHCQVGQTVELEVPFGSFYLREAAPEKALYFIAGGTGLSAFLAMLDQISASHQTIHLYYAVRHESHLCEQERAQLIKKISKPGLLSSDFASNRSLAGLQGYVQDHLAPDHIKSQCFRYVCVARLHWSKH